MNDVPIAHIQLLILMLAKYGIFGAKKNELVIGKREESLKDPRLIGTLSQNLIKLPNFWIFCSVIGYTVRSRSFQQTLG